MSEQEVAVSHRLQTAALSTLGREGRAGEDDALETRPHLFGYGQGSWHCRAL